MNTLHMHDYGIFVDNIDVIPIHILSYEDRYPSNPSIPQMRQQFGGSIIAGLDNWRLQLVTPADAVRNAMEGVELGGPTRFLLASGRYTAGHPGTFCFLAWYASMMGRRRQEMDGSKRKDVRIGGHVSVVLKHHQASGELTDGIVERVLTNSATHPHGIKVKLSSGQVGRVKEIHD